MGMTRVDFRSLIRRKFGAPLIKVELTDDQIDDAFNLSRLEYIKWAVGNSTQEVYFTLMLQAGQRIYNMPTGVVNILEYQDGGMQGTAGGINTLFSMENYMFNQGMFDGLLASQFNLISYHIARDFLETMRRYVVTKYNYRYHKYANQLEVFPIPSVGSSEVLTTTKALSADIFRTPGIIDDPATYDTSPDVS